jgi:hypothetical protein
MKVTCSCEKFRLLGICLAHWCLLLCCMAFARCPALPLLTYTSGNSRVHDRFQRDCKSLLATLP